MSYVIPGARVIKSIQRGTINLGASASGTATITAVDVNNSIARYLGNTYGTDLATTTSAGLHLVTLTNATTVTATRVNAGPGTSIVSYEVVEYYPGQIKRVQRGTMSLAGVTSNTATITAVDTTKAQLELLGTDTNEANGFPGQYMANIVLTNATTITATKGIATSTVTVSYQVTEFY